MSRIKQVICQTRIENTDHNNSWNLHLTDMVGDGNLDYTDMVLQWRRALLIRTDATRELCS